MDLSFGQAERKEGITSPGNCYIEKCVKMGSLSVFFAMQNVVLYKSKLITLCNSIQSLLFL